MHSWNDLPECGLKGEHRLGGRNHPSSYSTGNALGAIRASECTVQFDGFLVLFGLPCLQPLIHPGPTSSSAFVSA